MGAMELEEKTVQIRDDFDPDKILASGQCFRPRKQAEGWYRFVSGRQLLYLRPLRSGTYTVRCEPGAWETFWHGYFDLGRSYAALRGKLDSRKRAALWGETSGWILYTFGRVRSKGIYHFQ